MVENQDYGETTFLAIQAIIAAIVLGSAASSVGVEGWRILVIAASGLVFYALLVVKPLRGRSAVLPLAGLMGLPLVVAMILGADAGQATNISVAALAAAVIMVNLPSALVTIAVAAVAAIFGAAWIFAIAAGAFAGLFVWWLFRPGPAVPRPAGPDKEPTPVSIYLREVQRLDQEARAKKRFRNVEGFPFWPHEMVRNFAFICFFTAVMFGLSGFIPYYLESPADPSGQPQVILPDWYLLWSYGLLKIAVDVELFGATLFTAKVVGVLLNAVVIAPLFILPFVTHQHSRRPVADPFWAAVGMLGVGFAITLSVASIDSLFYVEWPFLSQQYFGWSVLYWLSLFTPIVMFFLTFWAMRKRISKTDGQTGYENKLSDNYFKIR